jgi:hypothetical protein
LRGKNITNIYVFDSIEYRREQLNEKQILYLNSIAEKQKYNDLRQQIIAEKGKDVRALIKIYFPSQDMIVVYPDI